MDFNKRFVMWGILFYVYIIGFICVLFGPGRANEWGNYPKLKSPGISPDIFKMQRMAHILVGPSSQEIA